MFLWDQNWKNPIVNMCFKESLPNLSSCLKQESIGLVPDAAKCGKCDIENKTGASYLECNIVHGDCVRLRYRRASLLHG